MNKETDKHTTTIIIVLISSSRTPSVILREPISGTFPKSIHTNSELIFVSEKDVNFPEK